MISLHKLLHNEILILCLPEFMLHIKITILLYYNLVIQRNRDSLVGQIYNTTES